MGKSSFRFYWSFSRKNVFDYCGLFTKWVEDHRMNNFKTVSTLKCLRKTFSVFSIPYILATDNGPLFVSEEFETFVKENGIKHLTIAPYHPSPNGLAERMVQTFKTTIKKITDNKNVPISIALSHFLCSYQNTPQTSTKKSLS